MAFLGQKLDVSGPPLTGGLVSWVTVPLISYQGLSRVEYLLELFKDSGSPITQWICRVVVTDLPDQNVLIPIPSKRSSTGIVDVQHTILQPGVGLIRDLIVATDQVLLPYGALQIRAEGGTPLENDNAMVKIFYKEI